MKEQHVGGTRSGSSECHCCAILGTFAAFCTAPCLLQGPRSQAGSTIVEPALAVQHALQARELSWPLAGHVSEGGHVGHRGRHETGFAACFRPAPAWLGCLATCRAEAQLEDKVGLQADGNLVALQMPGTAVP